MGKSKLAQAAKPSKGAEVKHLSSVKSGAVTKPSQTSKSKSKELAKQVATKSEKVGKKSKKAVKEPTPELSSDSESVDDSDEAMSSASGADSDDESDEVIDTPAVKANGVASNGVAKAADAETSDSSESSDSDADEAPVVPKAAAKGMNVATKSDQDSSDSSVEDSGDESDVESEADSSDDDKADAKPGAIDSKELNGKLAKIASKEVSLSPRLKRLLASLIRSRGLLPSQTTKTHPMLPLKQTHQTRMIRAKTKKKLPRQARSARLTLSPRLLPRKRRQMRWLAVSMMRAKAISSSGICPGTWTKNGSPGNSSSSGSSRVSGL